MDDHPTGAADILSYYLPIIYTWGKRDLCDPQFVEAYVQEVFLLVWQNRTFTARRLLYMYLRRAILEQMGAKAEYLNAKKRKG